VVFLMAGATTLLHAGQVDSPVKFINKNSEKPCHVWIKPPSTGDQTYVSDTISFSDAKVPSNGQKAECKPNSYVTIWPKSNYTMKITTKKLDKGDLFHLMVSNTPPDGKGETGVWVTLKMRLDSDRNPQLKDTKGTNKPHLYYDSTLPANPANLSFDDTGDISVITAK
jgi:hypothetical protein